MVNPLRRKVVKGNGFSSQKAVNHFCTFTFSESLQKVTFILSTCPPLINSKIICIFFTTDYHKRWILMVFEIFIETNGCQRHHNNK